MLELKTMTTTEVIVKKRKTVAVKALKGKKKKQTKKPCQHHLMTGEHRFPKRKGVAKLRQEINREKTKKEKQVAKRKP